MTAKTDGPSPEAALFEKIALVMAEVDRIPKRGRNDFHKYDYVLETDLVDEVRQKLAAKNVALIPSLNSIAERPYTTEKGKNSVVTTANVTFTFVCGDTGAMFRADWAGQGDDPADKGLYAAYTGALKYFLMKTFLIPTGDDPEANTQTDQRAQGRQAPPASNGPNPKQKGKLKAELTKSGTKQVGQLEALVRDVGLTEVLPIDADWMDRLTSRTISVLIEREQQGALPEPSAPSDIPDTGQDMELQPVGTDPDGTPF
jgi:hypothetical protein